MVHIMLLFGSRCSPDLAPNFSQGLALRGTTVLEERYTRSPNNLRLGLKVLSF